MTKTFTTAILLFFISVIKAQVPAGYYNNAYNGAVPKTCDVLKTALFNIISANTVELPYNSGNQFDTWNALNAIDTQRNDANTGYVIWDMYTDNPTGQNLYSFTPVTNQCGSYTGIGDCYNREHSFPQIWFGSVAPMQTDLHHLFATDGYSNGKHDNYPYGEVKPTSIDWVSPAGARLGASASPGFHGKVFEPIDAYKGDFARAMFYMVTRYQNLVVGWQGNTGADSVLNGTTWPSLDNWAISQWYKWHIEDPVSVKEINRNNKVYALQKNRNPFIDHPEYVELIWSCTGVLPVSLINFSGVKSNDGIGLKWSAAVESAFKEYVIERSSNGSNFKDIGVVKAQNISNYSFADNSLPGSGSYFYRLKMIDIDGSFTYSKTVNVKWNTAAGSLNIFPNPAFNQIQVTSQQAFQAGSMLTITDVAGRILTSQHLVNAGQLSFPVKINHLPAGRYVLSIVSKNDAIRQSFVVVR